MLMMMRPTVLGRIAALLVLACPALSTAQLLSPVSSGDQQQTGSADARASGAAASQVAVPSAQPAPYQPAVIDVPADAAAAQGAQGVQGAPASAQAPEAAPRGGPERPPPPPPSEYERFVSGVAGVPLRRFGADLLIPGSRDFTAPPTTTIPQDYRINPGDELQLGLTGSVQAANLRLKVDNEGRVFVPRVGSIMVGGVAYRDLHDVIAREVSRQYRGFDLQVSIARLHGVTVYVTGFAAQPGSYTVSSLSTLVNAVLAAGGPSAGGSFRSIQLRRNGQLLSDFDLYDLLLKGDKSGDLVVQNGDVIYIAPAGTQVAVIGSVNQQGIYEVAPGETIEQALLYAGGVNTVADDRRVMVLDALSQAGVGWHEVDAAQVHTQQVRRGDVIRVLSGVGIARPVEQQPVLVTISGEVARPGRYYFAPGTRMADVLAKAGGLTSAAFPYASVITRDSVREQQRVSFDRAIRDLELQLSAQPVTSANRAQLVSADNMTLIRSIVNQLRQRQPDGRLVFDLPVTATTLPADLIVENNDSIYVPPRPVTVGVFGAVPSPASFAYREGQTIGDAVEAAGGVQKLGDKGEIFVVRANGTVLAEGRRVLRERALPGDLIYVPIDANRGEFWARLRDITGSLFGGLIGLASVQAVLD